MFFPRFIAPPAVSILCLFSGSATGQCAEATDPKTPELAPAEEVAGTVAPANAWPLFRGTPEMSGASSARLKTPLKIGWTFETAGKDPITSTAVISDGRVYFGANDNKFYCLALEDGKKQWETELPDIIEGTACFAGDLVVVGCGDGFVYALDRGDGKERWKFETGSEVLGSTNVWKDEESGEFWILVGSYDNNLYCLNGADGAKRWAYETGNYINGAAAVGNGKAMFGGCDGVIYQIDLKTGKPDASIELGPGINISNTIAVGAGVAYVAHYGNRVAGYDLKDKVRIWEFGEREFPYFASPAIYKNWVVAASRDKRIYGIDRTTGKKVWEYRATDQVDSSPVIVGGELVFAGCDDGILYGLKLADGEEVWKYEIGAAIKGSPAVVDGKLLVGADDGVMYCFVDGE